MKIVYLLRGLAKDKKTNYFNSINNYKKNLFKYDYDIILHTYRTEYLFEDLLIKDLKPLYYKIDNLIHFDDNKSINSTRSFCNSILECIKMLENHIEKNNVEYDFIVITRYNLLLKVDIQFDKLDKNCIYTSYGNKSVQDDNIFVFNKKLFIERIKQLCYNRLRGGLIGLHRSVKNLINVKHLSKTRSNPTNNEIYIINRENNNLISLIDKIYICNNKEDNNIKIISELNKYNFINNYSYIDNYSEDTILENNFSFILILNDDDIKNIYDKQDEVLDLLNKSNNVKIGNNILIKS